VRIVECDDESRARLGKMIDRIKAGDVY
jgi:hypothetical protein